MFSLPNIALPPITNGLEAWYHADSMIQDLWSDLRGNLNMNNLKNTSSIIGSPNVSSKAFSNGQTYSVLEGGVNDGWDFPTMNIAKIDAT